MNEKNGVGKNGKFVPNCPTFLRFSSRFLTPPPFVPPSFVQATPTSKQHQALVPSGFAPLILAVRFSIRSTVCHVCCLMPWF